nr:hypothetical protein [Tanacetum cinerariifolium]
MTEFPQLDSGLTVRIFSQGDDPVACLNKAMYFMSVVATSRFPSTNNQLRTSSNPRNQTTIQDDRPKRPRNDAWFKEKAMLAEAQESSQILDEEQLAFLADPGILDGQAAQTTIPNTVAFQTKDLDAYDSDCDDVSNAKAMLMANLSNYGSVHHKKSLTRDDLKDASSDNQNALEILEYHENNDLKAQLQAKDTTICMLKEHIKSMREKNKEEKVKQEMDEIETINIDLEHSVAKLHYENERLHKEIKHLKNNYKDQFDSIQKTRALSKEHCDSLIAQFNSKSMENADLECQIQEKVFVTTTIQNELRRLKGKHVLDNATTITNDTAIAPGLFKLDIEPLSHRLKNNKDAHENYLKKTIENTDTIREHVERD